MVFTFLFEISDLWRHLAIFFNIFKIKRNVPFIGFNVENWIILTIFSKIAVFLKCYMNWLSQFEKNFGQKSPWPNSQQTKARGYVDHLRHCYACTGPSSLMIKCIIFAYHRHLDRSFPSCIRLEFSKVIVDEG